MLFYIAATLPGFSGVNSEIQKLEPSAIVELFEMDASSFGGDLLRFHAGTNGLTTNVVWQGNTYTAFPIQASGFDYSGNGQLPRPKLQVANLTGAITLLVLTYDDLLGAKITRKRTLAKYLDAVNFAGGNNLLLQSQTLNATPWISSGTVVSSSGDYYDGTIPFWTLEKNTTGGSAYRGQIFGAVAAGATRTATVALMAGTNSSVSVGLFAITALWGSIVNTSAEIISGPGTLSAYSGALWNVTGLSATVPTLLRVTRTYVTADTGGLYIYPGTATNVVVGTSVKATRAQVENGATPTAYQAVGSAWGTNPTADPTAEFADDIFLIDRKASETRDVVEFELAAAFDVAGVQLPRRQIIQNVCTWRYRGGECGYTGTAYFNANDGSVGSAGLDVCGKRLSSCKARFGANAPLPFGSFPAAGLTR